MIELSLILIINL